MRDCCNWALVHISIGGCSVFVWDLVRHAMGWTDGGVSLGFSLGDGAGMRCWRFLQGVGSLTTGSLVTLGVGWRVILGCFGFLSSILLARLVWAGVGLGIGTAGSSFSVGVAQL